MVFQVAPFIGGILPLALSVLLAYLWWGTLSRPWVFVVLSIVGLSLMAAIASFAFKGVGVSSAGSGPKPFLDPLEVKILLLTIGFVMVGTFSLWVPRLLLAKA